MAHRNNRRTLRGLHAELHNERVRNRQLENELQQVQNQAEQEILRLRNLLAQFGARVAEFQRLFAAALAVGGGAAPEANQPIEEDGEAAAVVPAQDGAHQDHQDGAHQDGAGQPQDGSST